MEGDTPVVEAEVGRKARTGLVGTLVVAYWLLDGIVLGIPVVVLSVVANPLVVFVVAAAVLVPLNVFFCRWLDGNWDAWFAGNAKRVETKLQKMRRAAC